MAHDLDDSWTVFDPVDHKDFGWPQEEPACPPCGDAGVVTAPATWWRGERRRPCPSCDPTRLDWWRHLLRSWWRRWRRPRPQLVSYTDEPPF